MSGSSLSIIDSLSPPSVSSVYRNFLDNSVIQGRVHRPIEMMAMDVRRNVDELSRLEKERNRLDARAREASREVSSAQTAVAEVQKALRVLEDRE